MKRLSIIAELGLKAAGIGGRMAMKASAAAGRGEDNRRRIDQWKPSEAVVKEIQSETGEKQLKSRSLKNIMRVVGQKTLAELFTELSEGLGEMRGQWYDKINFSRYVRYYDMMTPWLLDLLAENELTKNNLIKVTAYAEKFIEGWYRGELAPEPKKLIIHVKPISVITAELTSVKINSQIDELKKINRSINILLNIESEESDDEESDASTEY